MEVHNDGCTDKSTNWSNDKYTAAIKILVLFSCFLRIEMFAVVLILLYMGYFCFLGNVQLFCMYCS